MTDSSPTGGPQTPPQAMPPTGHGTDPLAIVALVTGICGVVLWWVPVLGFLSGAAGVVTGIINLYQRKPGHGMAIAGLVTGAIGVLGSIMFWGFILFLGVTSQHIVNQDVAMYTS